MKNVLKIMSLSFFLAGSFVTATKADMKTLCENKNISCSDLNYTKTISEKNALLEDPTAVCSECPLSHLYWACANRGVIVPEEKLDDTTSYRNETPPTCVVFPSCADLGYRLTVAQVKKISYTRSCSACPFDGSKWACVGSSGLLKVE